MTSCCGSCAMGEACEGRACGDSSEQGTLDALLFALAQRLAPGAINREGVLVNTGPPLTQVGRGRNVRYEPPKDSDGRFMQPWPQDEHGRPKGGVVVPVGRGPTPKGLETARHGDLVEVPEGIAQRYQAPFAVMWRIRPSSYWAQSGIHIGESAERRADVNEAIDANETWWWMSIPFSRGWQQNLAQAWASLRQRDMQPNIWTWRQLGKPDPTRTRTRPPTLAERLGGAVGMTTRTDPGQALTVVPARTSPPTTQPTQTTQRPPAQPGTLTRTNRRIPTMALTPTGLTRVPIRDRTNCLPQPSAGNAELLMLPLLSASAVAPAAAASFTLTFTALEDVTVDRLFLECVDNTTFASRPELVSISSIKFQTQEFEKGSSGTQSARMYASANSELPGKCIGVLKVPSSQTVTITGVNNGPNAMTIRGTLYASPDLVSGN